MNGVHDLGGMHGFGAVEREPNEPVFHTQWEKRVFAMRRVATGLYYYNKDQGRSGIERMDPAHYLRSTYYERWLDSLERVMVEQGHLTKEEIDARTAYFQEHPEAEVPRRDDPAFVERVRAGLQKGFAVYQEGVSPPRFKPGDAVVTRNIHPQGHTRLPRYARGKRGVIHSDYGPCIFPDASALGLGDQPQSLYSVRFDARELWGDAAEPREQVYLDLWDSYLDPA